MFLSSPPTLIISTIKHCPTVYQCNPNDNNIPLLKQFVALETKVAMILFQFICCVWQKQKIVKLRQAYLSDFLPRKNLQNLN